MSRAASCARKAVATPRSSMLTRLCAGALAFALSSSSSNSGIPEVASGPGEMDDEIELAPVARDERMVEGSQVKGRT